MDRARMLLRDSDRLLEIAAGIQDSTALSLESGSHLGTNLGIVLQKQGGLLVVQAGGARAGRGRRTVRHGLKLFDLNSEEEQGRAVPVNPPDDGRHLERLAAGQANLQPHSVAGFDSIPEPHLDPERTYVDRLRAKPARAVVNHDWPCGGLARMSPRLLAPGDSARLIGGRLRECHGRCALLGPPRAIPARTRTSRGSHAARRDCSRW